MSKAPMTTAAVTLGVLAALTAFPAWYRPAPSDVVASDLAGKLLMRGDKEVPADKIVDLRVVTWDDSQGKAKAFAVQKADGKWTIPSHFNYPADGGTRVGSTAGGVLSVPRGPKVPNGDKQLQELGVLDPLAEDAASKKTGIGKRVTLKDETGATVVDLIVGTVAPTGDGVRFVRDADSQDVYTAKINADISTAFTDWVETGLLKFTADDARSIIVRDYFVDTASGSVNQRAENSFDRKDSAAEWKTLVVPAEQQVAKDVVTKIVTESTGLKLQGVRPYRNQWLQARGFYQGSDKQLYGTEGRTEIATKDGMHFVLFFGSQALGDEQDTEENSVKKPTEADKKDATGKNRYLAIFVQYDEKGDEGLQKAIVEAGDAKQKADADAKDDKLKDAAKKADDRVAKLRQSGQDKAKKAQAKFLKYFYVISDESFKNMKPAADKLFEAKPKPAETKPADAKPADAKPADAAAAAAPAPVAPAPAPAAAPTPAPAPAK